MCETIWPTIRSPHVSIEAHFIQCRGWRRQRRPNNLTYEHLNIYHHADSPRFSFRLSERAEIYRLQALYKVYARKKMVIQLLKHQFFKNKVSLHFSVSNNYVCCMGLFYSNNKHLIALDVISPIKHLLFVNDFVLRT